MNVIAAIILPRSDEAVAQKVKEEDGKFMFGIDERCLLWTQDLCFPPWAWVYNNSATSFTMFSQRLIQATEKDGYSLEFIPSYGAGIATPNSPPNPVYGCKTIIMSDAARAADFQRSSGRLRDFDGCTRWSGMRIDEDQLWRNAQSNARWMANHALLATKTICPHKLCSVQKDGMSKEASLLSTFWTLMYVCADYVQEAIETTVAKTIKELKAVVICRRSLASQTLTLRFVKCENIDARADYNDVSSTALRKVMRKKTGVKLKEALDWMALSADLLWRCRSSWIDKAKLGTGCRIKLQEPIEELQLPESPISYMEPPHYDDPPSLEELKLRNPGLSLSVEEPPSLEPPMVHEDSPTTEKPQLLDEPPTIGSKKRRFSATGLEDDIEIVGDSAGGKLIPEDADIKKHGSCHF